MNGSKHRRTKHIKYKTFQKKKSMKHTNKTTESKELIASLDLKLIYQIYSTIIRSQNEEIINKGDNGIAKCEDFQCLG